MEDYELIIPVGDFGFEYCLSNEETAYLISKEDFIKLGKHELKWSKGEDGKPILVENDPTEENTRNLARQRIAELKKYLSDTDYIVAKIAEAETEEEKAELKEEYQAKLVLRKQWRKEINELEALI